MGLTKNLGKLFVSTRQTTWEAQGGTPFAVRSRAAVVASASILSRSQMARLRKAVADWQKEAWEHLDEVPELRFGISWLANSLSRARLYVGVIDPDGAGDPDPTDDERVRGPLAELHDGPTGHGQMLSRLGVHLSVPGESYLVGIDHPETAERIWMVCSAEEFETTSKSVKVQLPDSDGKVEVDFDSATIIRLWRPHPRRAWDADSPARAARRACDEIRGLSAHITASAESRLAGAGVLLVPNSATVHAATPPGDPDAPPVHPDTFVAAMVEAMVVPIQDRDAASAVVPIVLKVPDESIPHIKHVTFATPLDANAVAQREAAIRRLATALDVPAEVILGMGESNHWSAWQVEEAAIKIHVEPLLQTICDALTRQFLWPALEDLGVADVRQYAIWYDVSELALRPNLTETAQALHAAGLLSATATRREAGFSDDDAPTAGEQLVGLLGRLATAGNIEAANQLIELLQQQAEQERRRAVDAGEPPPALPPVTPLTPERTAPAGDPGRSLPDAPTASVLPQVAWQLGVVEGCVLKALERAGKYAVGCAGRSARGRYPDLEPWELHTRVPVADVDKALDGAWATMQQLLPDDPDLVAVADRYVRDLLATGTAHERRFLYDTLAAAGLTGRRALEVAGRA